jgi:hypothetical protein
MFQSSTSTCAPCEFCLHYGAMHELDISLPPFQFTIVNSDGFVNIHKVLIAECVQFNMYTSLISSRNYTHGLIGNTVSNYDDDNNQHDSDSDSDVDTLKQPLQNHAYKLPGNVESYAIDNNDIFGYNFKYNRFN